jgi:nickel/cobalt transporter (NiCoT) family protein
MARLHAARVRLAFLGLIAANVLAWIWAWSAFAGQPVLLGTALLAWVFGLRHAVDPDHIAAIDNVVRAQMQGNTPGQRDGPMLVGLYFSLGHSTVVVLASVVVAISATAMKGRLEAAKELIGLVGTAVSSGFLLTIALANLAMLRGIWRNFRRVRAHLADGAEGGTMAEDFLGGGLLARIFGPALRAVRVPWHMYPVGFLFGLGFDTATEVGLLGIAATQAAQGMSSLQVLVFPALFTAGMALVDTADSVMMVGAYGWAFVNPLRKLWYNLTITAASVIVALLIGGMEALALIAGQFRLEGGVWRVVSALNDDMADFGFAIVAIFALCWGVSALVYRRMGYDRLGAEGS